MNLTNLIIAGVPRSGKTILAKKLAATSNLSHISGDALIHAFEDTYPNLEISHDASDYKTLCSNFKPFLFRFLDSLYHFQIPYILDTFYITSQDIAELQIRHAAHAVVLGYPNCTVPQKLAEIRANEKTYDWTGLFDDNSISQDLERFILASKRLQTESATHAIEFVDVSQSWPETIEQVFTSLQLKIG